VSIAAARQGFVDVLSTIAGLHVYDVWPANLQTPAAVVVLSDWSYGTTYEGAMDATFLIVVIVPIGSVEKSQHDADAYLEISGADSIAAALRADPTLGGAVHVADVVGGTRYGPEDIQGVDLIAPAIQVEVKW
jgi:hypothetical protein